MNVRIRHLREEYKAAFEKYLGYRSKMIVGTDLPKRPIASMRTCHKHAKTIISNAPSSLVRAEYREVMDNFVRAGDIYYYAKKHGLNAAMLYKLSL